jgi:hypothetical protein
MRKALLPILLAACGGGGGDKSADAPHVDSTITVTGTAVTLSTMGSMPAAGVLVEAFDNADENTAVTNAMTDASGNYTLTITTNGKPLDGFIKATKSGLVDTYLYPPFALTANFSGASLNMVDSGTFSILKTTLCHGTDDSAKGTIAVLVTTDPSMASAKAVAGAMVSSSPGAATTCYNKNGFPNSSVNMTDTDGIGYLLNVTGNATVSATASGQSFTSHSVNSRAGALTTTLLIP